MNSIVNNNVERRFNFSVFVPGRARMVWPRCWSCITRRSFGVPQASASTYRSGRYRGKSKSYTWTSWCTRIASQMWFDYFSSLELLPGISETYSNRLSYSIEHNITQIVYVFIDDAILIDVGNNCTFLIRLRVVWSDRECNDVAVVNSTLKDVFIT